MTYELARTLPEIKRRSVNLSSTSIAPRPIKLENSELTVLVINSSHEMAKEITMQLNLRLPGCSITYAPTIDVAKWILNRKKIDLIVSSPVLPDGGIVRLEGSLQKLKSPPDVVVVGDMHIKGTSLFKGLGYEFATVRRFNNEPSQAQPETIPVAKKIKTLGADLRNDLNNPLQEIVAMVFVAQTGNEINSGTAEALKAIEGAAKNMAQVVHGIEDKIRVAVVE